MLAVAFALSMFYSQTSGAAAKQEETVRTTTADHVLGSSTGGLSPEVAEAVRRIPGVAAATPVVRTEVLNTVQENDSVRVERYPAQGLTGDQVRGNVDLGIVSGRITDLTGDTVVTVARVLVIGVDPAKLEGWDPEPVQEGIARGRARLGEYGIEADWCLVALDENPEGAIVEALTREDYACVVIGGGIRTHEPLLEFFEKVINMVRRHAPDAAIAFNSTPEDCADAALRWLR
jgi:hypothetical protein